MPSLDEATLIREAERNWSAIWQAQLDEKPQLNGNPKLRRLRRFLRRADSIALFSQTIAQELGSEKGKLILEAGCGGGVIASELAKKGQKVFALDVAFSALELTKKAVKLQEGELTLICASILELPFKRDTFDFIYNSGVIDHFGTNGRKQAISELLRVAKKKSKVVISTNDARSLLHSPAMNYAIRHRRWRYGFKVALRSLRDSVPEDPLNIRVREYSRGFLCQLEFLRYFLPGERWLQNLFYRIFHLFTFPFAFLNRLPGYHLFTVMEKNDFK
jgi:ubiquinone/menaquinone biosynthesis C-methylase UbiE